MVKKAEKKKLTPKQCLFCATYLSDPHLNGTKAYMRIYKVSEKVAGASAPRLLGNVRIKQYLSQLRNSIEKKEGRALLTAQQVEEKLDLIINQNPQDYYEEDGVTFKNIHDLTPEQAYALNEISHIETPIGSHVKIKFEGKRNAIDLKMRRLGLLKGDEPGGDTNIQINILNFSDKDLG